jgi:hypothetical protein
MGELVLLKAHEIPDSAILCPMCSGTIQTFNPATGWGHVVLREQQSSRFELNIINPCPYVPVNRMRPRWQAHHGVKPIPCAGDWVILDFYRRGHPLGSPDGDVVSRFAILPRLGS